MDKIKPGMIFISADGDGVGKLVGRAVLANDFEELHKVSQRIDAAQDFIQHWCDQVDGIKISGGGDEFTAAIPPEALDKLQEMRKSVEKSFGYSLSIGTGKTLSQAGFSLLAAKLKGKDQIVHYGKDTQDEIKNAKKRVEDKTASPDDYKLAQAYLEKAEDMACDLHKSEKKLCKMHKGITGHEKGVHLPTLANPGSSVMGSHVRNPSSAGTGSKEMARRHVGVVRRDLKTIKPKLEKSASLCELHKSAKLCNLHKAEKITPDDQEVKDNDKPSQGEKEKPKHEDHKGGEDNHTDDCPMCQEMDQQANANGDISGDHSDCPECARYDADNGISGNDDPANDGCPMCQEYDAAQGNSPDSNPVDNAGDAQHMDDCPQCQEMYSEASENQPSEDAGQDPNLQGHETAEEILDMLDQEPGSGTPPEEVAQNIDNTQLPQGDAMKDNVSVKENFGQAQKNDISDADQQLQQQTDPQDEPDMGSVLQSGLDEHAQDQNKQKVLDMVGQTLAGFKANKASLEATKEQNQPLYNSCIQMLKSMIELCKLLGLEPQVSEVPGQDPSQPTPPPAAPAAPAPESTPPAGGSPDPKA